MDVDRLIEVLEDETPVEKGGKLVTVHTGGRTWEKILEIVWCQECDQYHIISERLSLDD